MASTIDFVLWGIYDPYSRRIDFSLGLFTSPPFLTGSLLPRANGSVNSSPAGVYVQVPVVPHKAVAEGSRIGNV